MTRFVSYKKIILIIIIVLAVTGALFAVMHSTKRVSTPSVVQTVPPTILPMPISPVPPKSMTYHTITVITDDPSTELTAAFGTDNMQTILEINRIDIADVQKGIVLVVPDSFDDPAALSPFPATLSAASDIPKLIVVSLLVQAFAAYDSGTLVRWGGVNTGKQSTPTPSQLYFANWKGKKVISSEDDDWILPWYVNLDNKEGVSMHQYELPGYPASHACIRMFEADAEWVYNWVDQWTVSNDGETVLTHGTPVIVFGEYNYGKTAPWKNLPKNPAAVTISSDTLEKIVSSDKDAINAIPAS